jgi:beta-galactosidase
LLAALLPPVAGCMMDNADVSPPVIAQAPQAGTVADGGTVTLAVKAEGAGRMAYQWQRDGVAIAGAREAQYTTGQLGAADHRAQYRVLVSNAGGVASSVPVVLHVVAAETQASTAMRQSAEASTTSR